MPRVDPLQSAAAAYATARWEADEWAQLGRETGTSDLIAGHTRLYRSLRFGDPDYPDAAFEVLGSVLREGVDPGSGEKGRMGLLAESMPDLPSWVAENAPDRTKRLFRDYLAARVHGEFPEVWLEHHNVFDDYSGPTDIGDPVPSPTEIRATPSIAPAPPTTPMTDPGSSPVEAEERPSIFIVHGHNEAARDSIRIHTHTVTGVVPTSLAEEPGTGDTIIEKFERIGGAASCVIVLLTPDDVGQTVSGRDAGDQPSPRARQNVVLELGYFIGKIGRRRIIVMDAGVERPSDLNGLSYIAYPGENWKEALRRELDAMLP
jgi:hypothetical protein